MKSAGCPLVTISWREPNKQRQNEVGGEGGREGVGRGGNIDGCMKRPHFQPIVIHQLGGGTVIIAEENQDPIDCGRNSTLAFINSSDLYVSDGNQKQRRRMRKNAAQL